MKGRIKTVLLLGALVVFIGGCLATGEIFGPNLAYEYPEGCEGVGFINNLPTGTDLGTQTAIIIGVSLTDDAKPAVVSALVQMQDFLEGGPTRLAFALKVLESVEVLNQKYGKTVVALGQIMYINGWKDATALEPCDIDRLQFWINSNLANLELIP